MSADQVKRLAQMKRGLKRPTFPARVTLTIGELGIGINACELAIAHIEGGYVLDATDRRQLRQLRELDGKLRDAQGRALLKAGRSR